MNNKLKKKYIDIKTNNYKLIIEKNKDNFIVNKIKIIQKNGIFITGIHKNCNIKDLYKFKYLGQYGKINNISICKNNDKDRKFYSVFVEYTNKISSYLAIAWLNDFEFLENKKLKVSFSTNKPCKNQLIYNKCKKFNCVFYHGKINKSNSVLKIFDFNNSEIFNFFHNKAINYLYKKKSEIINHYNTEDAEETIFPNIKLISKILNNNLSKS